MSGLGGQNDEYSGNCVDPGNCDIGFSAGAAPPERNAPNLGAVCAFGCFRAFDSGRRVCAAGAAKPDAGPAGGLLPAGRSQRAALEREAGAFSAFPSPGRKILSAILCAGRAPSRGQVRVSP